MNKFYQTIAKVYPNDVEINELIIQHSIKDIPIYNKTALLNQWNTRYVTDFIQDSLLSDEEFISTLYYKDSESQESKQLNLLQRLNISEKWVQNLAIQSLSNNPFIINYLKKEILKTPAVSQYIENNIRNYLNKESLTCLINELQITIDNTLLNQYITFLDYQPIIRILDNPNFEADIYTLKYLANSPNSNIKEKYNARIQEWTAKIEEKQLSQYLKNQTNSFK